MWSSEQKAFGAFHGESVPFHSNPRVLWFSRLNESRVISRPRAEWAELMLQSQPTCCFGGRSCSEGSFRFIASSAIDILQEIVTNNPSFPSEQQIGD